MAAKPLQPDIRKDIIERTDGIALFAEEVLETELEAMQTAATLPSPALGVLHASLMTRRDQLGPAKEVALLFQTTSIATFNGDVARERVA